MQPLNPTVERPYPSQSRRPVGTRRAEFLVNENGTVIEQSLRPIRWKRGLTPAPDRDGGYGQTVRSTIDESSP